MVLITDFDDRPRCEICDKVIIINKTGFNLLTRMKPFNQPMQSKDRNMYVPYEVFVCQDCFKEYMAVLAERELSSYILNFFKAFTIMINPARYNLKRCHYCGKVFHDHDDRRKYHPECYKIHRKKYKRDKERESYQKKIQEQKKVNQRICDICGLPLPLNVHGNTKYHKECQEKVEK